MKNNRIISLFLSILMVLTMLPTTTLAASTPSVEFEVPEEIVVGTKTTIKVSLSSDVRKTKWTLRRNGAKKSVSSSGKTYVTFTPRSTGEYTLSCKVTSRKSSTTVTKSFTVVSEIVKEIPAPTIELTAPTEVLIGEEVSIDASIQNASSVSWQAVNGAGVNTDTSALSKTGGTITFSEEGTYVVTATAVNEADVSVSKSVTITASAPVVEEELAITDMSVPSTAIVGEPFEVSGTASGASYLKWYVNKDGEDYPVPDGMSENGGIITFDEPGAFDIIFMAFDEDWNHVHKTMTVTVLAAAKEEVSTANKPRAMYSWSENYVHPSNEDLLQTVMEKTNCNILYQEIGADEDPIVVADFLNRRAANGQTVYYLCGDAAWATETDAHSMLAEVERAAMLNDAATGAKFVGIQFDVEPYCLKDFDDNADAYFTQYVENCKTAYQAAHKAGLLVELCIPYWWDSAYGFNDQLEDLIVNACDSVAVMNYYKRNSEARHISNELELCKKYDKPIINITEMQPVGTHGLTENNTYYADGIDAVETMWNGLEATFGYEKLGYSYHYLNTMVKLLGLS